mmetsp:Transcript_71362/g.212861  ORF Transcript_71362/g.212861 Transcript_71362/m.212861 type:complete len:283 (+) Transcript_71362:243-1091(+)
MVSGVARQADLAGASLVTAEAGLAAVFASTVLRAAVTLPAAAANLPRGRRKEPLLVREVADGAMRQLAQPARSLVVAVAGATAAFVAPPWARAGATLAPGSAGRTAATAARREARRALEALGGATAPPAVRAAGYARGAAGPRPLGTLHEAEAAGAGGAVGSHCPTCLVVLLLRRLRRRGGMAVLAVRPARLAALAPGHQAKALGASVADAGLGLDGRALRRPQQLVGVSQHGLGGRANGPAPVADRAPGDVALGAHSSLGEAETVLASAEVAEPIPRGVAA